MSEEKDQATEIQGQDEGKQADASAELQAKLEQAEKEKALLKEDLDRERRVNELLDGMDKAPDAPSYEPQTFLGDGYEEIDKRINEKFQEQQQKIWKQMQTVTQNTIAQQQAMSKLEQMYYSKYPQHKGWEDVVNRESTNLASELGERIHSMSFDAKMESLAKKVNAEIARMKERLGGSSLPIEGGSMSEPNTPTKEPEAEILSEDERAAKAFKDVAGMRQNKTLRR